MRLTLKCLLLAVPLLCASCASVGDNVSENENAKWVHKAQSSLDSMIESRILVVVFHSFTEVEERREFLVLKTKFNHTYAYDTDGSIEIMGDWNDVLAVANQLVRAGTNSRYVFHAFYL